MAGGVIGKGQQQQGQYIPGVGWVGAPPPANTPIQNQYGLYNEAVGQNSEDYDSIMGGFKGVLANIQNNQAQQIKPETYNYQRSGDVTSALGIQKNLAQTGGYTDEGIRDLRARGISPIRSVYANANRDIDRSVALSGGMSPNYTAAKAKMAREMSEKISNAAQDVNAGIAQNVASNKINAAPSYASTALGESTLQNNIGMKNVDAVNSANIFNANAANQGNNNALGALQGMTSLYGTTPAMTKLFGDQASEAAGMEANSKARAQANAYGAINSLSQRIARR